MIYKLCLLLFGWLSVCRLSAQNDSGMLRIRIVDQYRKPVFGVYVGYPKKAILLNTSDIDGECVISHSIVDLLDTIQFQGIGYVTQKITLKALQANPLVQLQELKYELPEAQVKGVSIDRLLKLVSQKLKKQKFSRIPLCRYYGPAQYEKITQCRDTTVEYRREYGFYFTSGDLAPYNIWDRTFRSYFVPQYVARSYNLSPDGRDTLTPLYLTHKEVRFDIGTRKIFTLQRAIQLFGPLFSDQKYYEIRPIESDSRDYTFSFQTRSEAYPSNTRISCKGTFTIDNTELSLKRMDFDYIDYQLMRQILLSNQRKITSPFSTKASLIFATDSAGQSYVRFCHQQTIWKYDLGEEFLLIEQPSRDLPGYNRLVEEEAFYCYDYLRIKPELQTPKILSWVHLVHRYPSGTYVPELFDSLPLLLDNRKATRELSKYMCLENQFMMNSDRAYYPENYISGSDIDFRERSNYLRNLYEVRMRLYRLFGDARQLNPTVE